MIKQENGMWYAIDEKRGTVYQFKEKIDAEIFDMGVLEGSGEEASDAE